MNDQMDNDELMVSIRCLTYNHEPYIRQCLEGFIMHKTNFRFEAVVHDDASTDGTVAIIREYAEKYPNIIKPIYEIENQYSKHDGSLGKIMNAACTGKYIAMCEGDDYWIDPLKLQKQVDFLESHSDYYVVGMRSLLYRQDIDKYDIYKNSIHFSTSFSVADYIKNILMHTSTFLVRRENISFEQMPQGILQSDIYFILHSSCKGKKKIKVLKNIGTVYRKHGGGITYSSNNMNLEKSYESMCKILNSYDVYSEYKMHDVVCYKKHKMKLLIILQSATIDKKINIIANNVFLLFKVCVEVFKRKSVEAVISTYLLLFSMCVKRYIN